MRLMPLAGWNWLACDSRWQRRAVPVASAALHATYRPCCSAQAICLLGYWSAGQWLAPATRLTRLFIAAPTVTVPPGFGSLTTLRTLQFDSWDARVILQVPLVLPSFFLLGCAVPVQWGKT